MLACRLNEAGRNVRGSVGQPIPGTSLRFVHPETLADVADGEQGLILARGPGVMQASPKPCLYFAVMLQPMIPCLQRPTPYVLQVPCTTSPRPHPHGHT